MVRNRVEESIAKGDANAIAVLSGLPRDALGAAALPLELVARSYTLHTYTLIANSGRPSPLKAFRRYIGNLDHERVNYKVGLHEKIIEFTGSNKRQERWKQVEIRAQAEVVLWWSMSGDPLLVNEAARLRADDSTDIDRWVALYEYVMSRPEALPYISNGIWSQRYIEKCLAEGIDPSLAKSLL